MSSSTILALSAILGPDEYQNFLSDAIKRAAPKARYVLAFGAVVAAISALALAIIGIYVQSALFGVLCFTSCFGAHYMPRHNANELLQEMEKRNDQIQKESSRIQDLIKQENDNIANRKKILEEQKADFEARKKEVEEARNHTNALMEGLQHDRELQVRFHLGDDEINASAAVTNQKLTEVQDTQQKLARTISLAGHTLEFSNATLTETTKAIATVADHVEQRSKRTRTASFDLFKESEKLSLLTSSLQDQAELVEDALKPQKNNQQSSLSELIRRTQALEATFIASNR